MVSLGLRGDGGAASLVPARSVTSGRPPPSQTPVEHGTRLAPPRQMHSADSAALSPSARLEVRTAIHAIVG